MLVSNFTQNLYYTARTLQHKQLHVKCHVLLPIYSYIFLSWSWLDDPAVEHIIRLITKMDETRWIIRLITKNGYMTYISVMWSIEIYNLIYCSWPVNQKMKRKKTVLFILYRLQKFSLYFLFFQRMQARRLSSSNWSHSQ